jgi:hypothetical protein
MSSITSQKDADRAEPKTDAMKEVGRQVLGRMSDMIDEMKLQRKEHAEGAKTRVERKAQKDIDMLTSVLEEQFHAMETWLLPMSHGEKKSKQKVIAELMERFEAMVKGYNKLIDVLKSKYKPEEPGSVSKEKTQRVKPKTPKKTKSPPGRKKAD